MQRTKAETLEINRSTVSLCFSKHVQKVCEVHVVTHKLKLHSSSAGSAQHCLRKCQNFNGILIWVNLLLCVEALPSDNPLRSCFVIQLKACWRKFYLEFCLNTDTCYCRLMDYKVWLAAGFQPQVQCKNSRYKNLGMANSFHSRSTRNY